MVFRRVLRTARDDHDILLPEIQETVPVRIKAISKRAVRKRLPGCGKTGSPEIINAHKTWGNKFIENLSRDLQTEYPDAKGFSVRNLKYMAKFASTYPDDEFVQTVSAQISWSHNIAIIDKVKDQQKRIWYLHQNQEGSYDTNHKPCDFLQKDGSCLLGDCKPVNCAEFPFTARPDRWASLLGIVSNASVCPVLFEMLEILKDEYGFVYHKKSRR